MVYYLRLNLIKIYFETFERFINSINLDYWIYLYIFFEISLIKDLGYDPNLDQFIVEENGPDTEKN